MKEISKTSSCIRPILKFLQILSQLRTSDVIKNPKINGQETQDGEFIDSM